jgi:hypothetical protein
MCLDNPNLMLPYRPRQYSGRSRGLNRPPPAITAAEPQMQSCGTGIRLVMSAGELPAALWQRGGSDQAE